MGITALHCVACEDRYDIRGDSVEKRTVRCPECGHILSEDLSDWGAVPTEKDRYKKETLAQCELKNRLWAGAESITYRAEHKERSMPVLFELWPHDKEGYDEEWIHQLFRGIAAASELRHPNVVVVYDLGRREDFDFCMREIADGGKVRSWIEKRGSVNLGETLPIIEDALRVLKVAERKDLYSGRISPDTFLLDYDDSLKMEFFGRPYHPRELQEFTVTPWGKLTGPSYYVAPEQVDDPNEGSIQSDLYSLGLTMYEMLSGAKPFDGETAREILEMRRREQPVAISSQVPDLPQEVCSFLNNLIAPAPEDRPDSASETLESFRTMAQKLSEKPDLKDGPTIAENREAKGQHMRAIMWTLLAFFLIAISIIPFYRIFTEESEAEKRARKAQQMILGHGRVLIVMNRPASGDQADVMRAFLPMAAMQVDAVGKLGAIDPYLTQQMAGVKGGMDQALLKTDPTYLVKMEEDSGQWRLRFRSVKGRDWVVEKEIPRGSITDLTEGLNDLMTDVAKKIEVPDYRPIPLPRDLHFWAEVSGALKAERRGDFTHAIELIEGIAESDVSVPYPVRVIRAYCERALAWREKQSETPGDLQELADAESAGEWSALARVLRALKVKESDAVRAELAKFLGERPNSPRGFYLLGHWRLKADMPPQEAIATFWQGVETDPGYMPNIRAVLDLAAEKGEERLQKALSKYREAAWHPGQIDRAEEYAGQLH